MVWQITLCMNNMGIVMEIPLSCYHAALLLSAVSEQRLDNADSTVAWPKHSQILKRKKKKTTLEDTWLKAEDAEANWAS